MREIVQSYGDVCALLAKRWNVEQKLGCAPRVGAVYEEYRSITAEK
jgi:hypothetical protein